MTVFELLQILQQLDPDQQLDVDVTLDVDVISDVDGFSQDYPLDGVRDGNADCGFETGNKGKL